MEFASFAKINLNPNRKKQCCMERRSEQQTEEGRACANLNKHFIMIHFPFLGSHVVDICENQSPILQFLNLSNSFLHTIMGGGSCLLRCLSFHLWGTDDHHTLLRTLLLNFESQNSDVFKSFLFNGNTMADHISRILHPSTWGTLMEILAAASLFHVPIYECVQSNHSGSYHWEVHHPITKVDCQLANNDFLQKSVIPSHFELFYKKNLHYDCVIDKHTKVVSTSLPQIISTHVFFYLEATVTIITHVRMHIVMETNLSM